MYQSVSCRAEPSSELSVELPSARPTAGYQTSGLGWTRPPLLIISSYLYSYCANSKSVQYSSVLYCTCATLEYAKGVNSFLFSVFMFYTQYFPSPSPSFYATRCANKIPSLRGLSAFCSVVLVLELELVNVRANELAAFQIFECEPSRAEPRAASRRCSR